MESGQVCRLCAHAATVLLPIFEEEGMQQELPMKIHKYLPVQVSRDDCLPDHVCYSCSATLNAWHNLVEECVSADKMFRDLIGTQQKHEAIVVEKQAGKDETDSSVGVTCGISRCDQASSILSKFRIKRSLDPKIILDESVSENISTSNLSPRERVHCELECHSDDSDTKDHSHKNVETDTKLCVGVGIYEQRFTAPGSSQCEESLLKSSDKCEELSIIPANDAEQLQKHSVLDFNSFDCDKCQTSLNTQLELAAHTTDCHNCQSSCKHRDKVCNSKDQLDAHELLHQKETPRCPVCGKGAATFKSLKHHFTIHSDAGLELCSLCNNVFANKSELERHEATHQNERSYLCEMCGKSFRYKANMLSHCSTHLDDSIARKFKCDFCGTLYRSKNILKRHLVLHSNDGKKNYMCETCGKSFSTVQSLNVHVKVHSNSRPYKCTVCEMAFKWKKNLRTHQRVHGAVAEKQCGDEHKRRIARVQCDVCGKYLASKWNLSVHVKRHDVNFTGSSMCHICGKTLCDSQAMSRHLKVHAGIKSFKCEICGKNFGTKMSRDDHERTHTGEKPFCCDVCGKCFSSKPHLHVHRVIHSDNRPFKCTYCPKSFRRRPHLVLHVRTHTGEKPYSCQMCSRAFIQKNDMVKHMLTHSNERPFVCECGVSFRQKRDLNKHKRKHTDAEISFPTAIPCI